MKLFKHKEYKKDAHMAYLLSIVLANIDQIIRNGHAQGLCGTLRTLRETHRIGIEDFLKLRQYIWSCEPKNSRYGAYYWKPGAIAPRKRFLRRHIRRLS